MIEIHTDGLVEPKNPGGIGTFAYIMHDTETEETFKEYGFIGSGEGISNNVAEYKALIYALERALELNFHQREIIVYSDNAMLINQMKGSWNVHQGVYIPYYQQAKNLLTRFTHINFYWIPRERNTEADLLSKEAYISYCQKKGIEVRWSPYHKRKKPKKEFL